MNPHYPRLILTEKVCRSNIVKMTDKAFQSGVTFRPHFKTHQSRQIGRWFRDAGINCVTVSSIRMAEYFVADGWRDIFIAFPVNFLESDRINKLAQNTRLSISLDAPESAVQLDKKITTPVDVYIKIDTGYHRTGIQASDHKALDKILSILKNSTIHHFKGFYTHAGQSYDAKDQESIIQIYKESASLLNRLKARYLGDFPELIVSVGDTPSCSIVHDFSDVDEIRPGNFVFYDLMQWQLGACDLSDIAVVLECPVLGIYPERNEIMVHGGAVHLSKENLLIKGNSSYGLIVQLEGNSWRQPVEETYVSSLSQEHGIIKTNKMFINRIKVGDTIGILPVHSCLTANLADQFVTMDGQLIEKMRS